MTVIFFLSIWNNLNARGVYLNTDYLVCTNWLRLFQIDRKNYNSHSLNDFYWIRYVTAVNYANDSQKHELFAKFCIWRTFICLLFYVAAGLYNCIWIAWIFYGPHCFKIKSVKSKFRKKLTLVLVLPFLPYEWFIAYSTTYKKTIKQIVHASSDWIAIYGLVGRIIKSMDMDGTLMSWPKPYN